MALRFGKFRDILEEGDTDTQGRSGDRQDLMVS
jgi:hypothetical protein